MARVLTDAVRAAFAAAGTPREFRAGAVLFHEGDPSEHVLLIGAGRVKIVAAGTTAELTLAVRAPGDLVGELSAIDGQPRSATAVALEPLTAVVIPAAAFRRVLAERADAAVAVLTMVVARLRDADRLRVEFGSAPALTRVAARLLQLAEEHGTPADGGGVQITLPVTQEELAGWVGASRESVVRALAALRDSGTVITARRAITVCDPVRLRAIAGGAPL